MTGDGLPGTVAGLKWISMGAAAETAFLPARLGNEDVVAKRSCFVASGAKNLHASRGDIPYGKLAAVAVEFA